MLAVALTGRSPSDHQHQHPQHIAWSSEGWCWQATTAGACSWAEHFSCENQQATRSFSSWFCPGTNYVPYLTNYLTEKSNKSVRPGLREDKEKGKGVGKGEEGKQNLPRDNSPRFRLAGFLSRLQRTQTWNTERRETHFRLQIHSDTTHRPREQQPSRFGTKNKSSHVSAGRAGSSPHPQLWGSAGPTQDHDSSIKQGWKNRFARTP